MHSASADEITSDWEEAVSSPVVSSSGAVSVCVIGAGVAGLGAAWHLCSSADVTVTVLEASDEAGGHANTIDVLVDGGSTVAVDTGFMVFNHPNYPNLVGLFKELGVRSTNCTLCCCTSIALLADIFLFIITAGDLAQCWLVQCNLAFQLDGHIKPLQRAQHYQQAHAIVTIMLSCGRNANSLCCDLNCCR
jgi:uncharacterized protein with NAD-binding domain and iron-sulfur cluster